MAASLNYRETPKWHVDKVRMIAAQCNKQKYNAKKASELSTEMYTLKYIERNSPVVTDAAVVEVREKYIDVIIIAMGLNRRIFFNNVSYQNIFENYIFYGIENIFYLWILRKLFNINNIIISFLFQDFPGKYQCIKNDCAKLSKMEIIWNAVNDSPPVKQVIQVFSILQVELYRGDEMVKVETKLVRPLPEVSS